MIEIQVKKELQVMIFYQYEKMFAVPVNFIKEIISADKFSAMSREPSSKEKIVNIKGDNIPVINLNTCKCNSSGQSSENFIIVLNVNNQCVGIDASEIKGIEKIKGENLEPMKNSDECFFIDQFKMNKNTIINIINPLIMFNSANELDYMLLKSTNTK